MSEVSLESSSKPLAPEDVQLSAPLQVLRDPEDLHKGVDPEYDSPVESVEDYVQSSLTQLESRLELVLDNISEELASEVSRERQHLMLMQEQVDKQAHSQKKEIADMQKRLEQEKTQRALVMQKSRETNDHLNDSLQSISKEMEELRHLVHRLKTPWLVRMFQDVCGVFNQCSATGTHYVSLS